LLCFSRFYDLAPKPSPKRQRILAVAREASKPIRPVVVAPGRFGYHSASDQQAHGREPATAGRRRRNSPGNAQAEGPCASTIGSGERPGWAHRRGTGRTRSLRSQDRGAAGRRRRAASLFLGCPVKTKDDKPHTTA
jgi:hypothetical protein